MPYRLLKPIRIINFSTYETYFGFSVAVIVFACSLHDHLVSYFWEQTDRRVAVCSSQMSHLSRRKVQTSDDS